mmetsp:Transcript_27993/g.30597  ORF Transcript_27993/g.30597 Transcript_27993/m.30597 type:complete len:99 (-) Transcript_27993:201-497(-)
MVRDVDDVNFLNACSFEGSLKDTLPVNSWYSLDHDMKPDGDGRTLPLIVLFYCNFVAMPIYMIDHKLRLTLRMVEEERISVKLDAFVIASTSTALALF